jgi:hypothetical protein
VNRIFRSLYASIRMVLDGHDESFIIHLLSLIWDVKPKGTHIFLSLKIMALCSLLTIVGFHIILF